MTALRKSNVLPPVGTARGELSLNWTVPYRHDQMKMHVAISAAGVFYTEDGSRSWQPRNRGTRADFLPDKHFDRGQCVHKLLPAADGMRLYQQNHCSVYRSDSSRDCQDSARLLRLTFHIRK
jgi:hypothetical protein